MANGNNGRGRRRGAPARAPTNAQLAVQMREMERRITGHKTVPANNPPAFVQLPWNTFTYERSDTTEGTLEVQSVTVTNILTQLVGRVGLGTTVPRIKVQSAQVWCTVAGTLVHPDIQVSFYELSGETSTSIQQPRSTQRDLGTLNMPAKCGYKFPMADTREIVGTDAGGLTVLSATAVEEGSIVTSRVQILWQASPTT